MKSKLEINKDGNKYWKNKDGQLHRENGPAIEYVNGYRVYYIHGKRHREDGPAVEMSDGYKSYYINGKRHREDGPAIEYPDGYKSYYIHGKKLTPEQFKKSKLKNRQ